MKSSKPRSKHSSGGLPTGKKKKQNPLPDTAAKVSFETELNKLIDPLSTDFLCELANDWQLSARPEQLPPKGNWLTWLLLGGRGAGKTRAGAEWIHDAATLGSLNGDGLTYGRIALVAETLADAREIMVDGQSGILNIARQNRPVYETSRRRLLWPNGAIAQIFSSEDPESLRCPQFDAAWCDELCKWRYTTETWDMLQFGLRLGSQPRQLITTTPKAGALLKVIMADKQTKTVRMRTSDNAANLSVPFLKGVTTRYGDTRLGRQELDGEILEDRDDALWNRAQLEALRIDDVPDLTRVIIAVDPPAIASAKHSCCGIIVAGLCENGQTIVLKDGSLKGASPVGWAGQVARLYHQFEADKVIAEINQGGDMVKSVLHAADCDLPVTNVRASRGKWLRAEPVAALYEQGKIRHLGAFKELEDQMCNFGADGVLAGSGGNSPDRLDALVWAITALMLDQNTAPTIRSI